MSVSLCYNAPIAHFCTQEDTMYVDKCTAHANGKTYTRYLLRESRREGKKTIKTTILNITPWGERTCEALRFALANQKRLGEIGIHPADRIHPGDHIHPAKHIHPADLRKTLGDIKLTQQSPVGDVWLLHQKAMQNGLVAALGDSRDGRLALWQILARTLDQGSRLSAVRLARMRETDFLRLGKFSENDLYKNLDWIAGHQHAIENALFKRRHGNKPCRLFLYDVTSSYFEGIENELANYEERHARGEWIASTRVEMLFGRSTDDGMTSRFRSDANIAA